MPLNLADLSCEATRIGGEVAISFQYDYFEKLGDQNYDIIFITVRLEAKRTAFPRLAEVVGSNPTRSISFCAGITALQ
jgi:hypothetical protein